jgi:alpha,alpha-trehalase
MPLDAVFDRNFPLRSLAVRETIPVDLNSILYATEAAIANFHLKRNNAAAFEHYQSLADHRVKGMYDLMFNFTEFRYFDFNLSSNSQNVVGWIGDRANLQQGIRFYPQQFWPVWLGAVPESLSNPESIEYMFQSVSQILDENLGAIGASNLVSGTLA